VRVLVWVGGGAEIIIAHSHRYFGQYVPLLLASSQEEAFCIIMNMLAMQSQENLDKLSRRCDAILAKVIPTDSMPFIEALGRDFLPKHDILSSHT
jgi:hypothetical protein